LGENKIGLIDSKVRFNILREWNVSDV